MAPEVLLMPMNVFMIIACRITKISTMGRSTLFAGMPPSFFFSS